jgi:hypothetical protein
MKRTTTRSISLLAILLLTLSALGTSVAQATVIHSNVAGTTVNYTNITEGAVTADPEPLYGQPFANGNSLIFTPTADFSAVSTSGGPADQTDGKLSFIITAKPGFAVDKLDFEEVGLTVLNAPFGGDAFTSVLAFTSIKVLAVSGAPVTSSPTTHFFSFAPDSSFLHSADATGPSFATPWVGTLSVTMPNNVSKVLVTLDNHLYAATVGVGTGARIGKDVFSVDVDVDLNPDYIPEPGTLLLGFVGAALIGLRRRG